MESEQLLAQLVKAIGRRIDQLALSVTSGGVDNMEKYNYIIGQINAYEALKQELSSLLEDKEQNDNKGTIGDINKRNPKT